MGAALFALMEQIEGWFLGGIGERALGIAAIMIVGVISYGAAAALLGVLDKASVQRLMRRQG
jgi:putative peptidoglycan lipid II flippase